MKRIVGLIVSLVLSLGVIGVFTAVPAEAATYVQIVNFSDTNVYVNGHKVKPGRHIDHIKRKTMRIKVHQCSFVEGQNRNGSHVARRSYLNKIDVYYSGGSFKSNKRLPDGDLNRFGIFQVTCR